jgi:hypothetical protein
MRARRATHLQLADFNGHARAVLRHALLRVHQRVALLAQLRHASLRPARQDAEKEVRRVRQPLLEPRKTSFDSDGVRF